MLRIDLLGNRQARAAGTGTRSGGRLARGVAGRLGEQGLMAPRALCALGPEGSGGPAALVRERAVRRRPAPAGPPPRRVPLLPLALALLLLSFVLGGLVAAQRAVEPPAPEELTTLVLSGPDVAGDTWIGAALPDQLADPATPDVAFADAGEARLQFAGGAAADRLLLRFDLRSIPAGVTIEQARLRVHVEPHGGSAGEASASVDAYRVRRPWNVRQVTYAQPWSAPGLQPGLDHDSQPLGTRVITGATWLEFDITTAARDWHLFSDSNTGLMLKLSNAPAGQARYVVHLSDHDAPSLRPRLELDYRPGPPGLRSWSSATISGTQVLDTWLVSSLPTATSAVELLSRPEPEVRWLTHTYAPTATTEVLRTPFFAYPRLRIDQAGGGTQLALFDFSMTDIPVVARIEQARLAFYLEPALPAPPNEASVVHYPASLVAYRLLKSWEQETASYSFPWSQPGLVPEVDYDSVALARQEIAGPGWISLDLGSAVESWHAGRNDGLIVMIEQAPEGLAPYWVASSEAPQAHLRPRLYVAYTMP